MMDDLTPEEREALKNLPRERMPSAGLEDQVVGAMRSRGLLTAKKRGHVLRLTTSRVAGLLAACIVLIVGAYSIGLQRGDRMQTIIGVQPPELGVIPYSEAPRESQAVDVESLESLADATTESQATSEPPPSPLAKRERTANKALETPEETKPSVKLDLRQDEVADDAPAAAGLAAEPAPAAGDIDVAERKQKEQIGIQPPSTMSFEARDALAPQALTESAARPRTYQLGGSTFIVDGPDGVRIVESEDGREILIYTSDGLIRIRLAD